MCAGIFRGDLIFWGKPASGLRNNTRSSLPLLCCVFTFCVWRCVWAFASGSFYMNGRAQWRHKQPSCSSTVCTYFYLFMIIKKGKENQVPSNCVLISHCQNHNQRTWMCCTILGGGDIIQLKGRKEGQAEHYSPFFLINRQLLTANSEWLTVAEHNQMPRKKQKDKTHWKIHLILLTLLQCFLCWHLLLVNSLDRCVAFLFFLFYRVQMFLIFPTDKALL